MPWSTALRTMCVSGSLIASMIVLSSSVSLPSISSRDLLAAGRGQVADHARELVPDVADRLHARLHDAFLQLGGDQVQPLRRAAERGCLRGVAVNCSIWLRASTSSPTRFISLSSRATSTRMVLLASS